MFDKFVNLNSLLAFLSLAYVDAFLVKQSSSFFLVLGKAPLPGVVHIVGPSFSIGMLGQDGSSMLKRVLGRHVPLHDSIFCTELHPLGRLVASYRTHVVNALVGAYLGYASVAPHFVEPSSEAVCNEGDLGVARGVCLLHQVDEPVPLLGD